MLQSSVDRLSSSCDEEGLKVLVNEVLAKCYQKNQELEMASQFENLSSCETTPATPTSECELDSFQIDDSVMSPFMMAF